MYLDKELEAHKFLFINIVLRKCNKCNNPVKFDVMYKLHNFSTITVLVCTIELSGASLISFVLQVFW